MKILFILENYLPHIGGVEIVFKNLISGLVKQGHDLTVLTHKLPNTPKEEIIDGAKIIRISCFNSRYLFSFFAIPKAIKLAKQADIIHATTFNGAPPGWFSSKVTGKPILLTVHEVWINRWTQLTQLNPISAFIHDLLERMIYFLSYDKYACVSKSTQNQLLERNIKQNKTSVIYNGLDYNLWDPKKYSKSIMRKKLNLNTFTLFCSGRPGVSKGIEYAVKALPIVLKSIPDAKLLLILSKDPAYKKRYNMILKLIDQLNLKQNIILKDPVPYHELPNYMIASDCVVIPSIAEGFGFSAAEASALGIPVAVSNTTSLPEVVSGKFVLVKPKNPESIAKGIIAIKNKKYQTKPLVKFTWEDNVKKYLNLYKSLLKN
tara:strand:+ start:11583 stop:12707 length:1125 start_codon:yes stop_codon:yes gene_type:complete